MWLKPSDVQLEDLLTVLKQQTDPADYPYAERIEQQRAAVRRGADPAATDPRARAGRAGPGARRRARASSSSSRPSATRSVVDAARADAFERDYRPISGRERCRRRRPLRQAGCERSGVECAREARGRAHRVGLRGLLRERHPRARLGRLARARLPDHLSGQRGQPGRLIADRTPRLPPRFSCPATKRRNSPLTRTACLRC